MYYKSTTFYENREAVFQKTKIFNFFLMWTTLHSEGRLKTNKKRRRKKEKGRQEIFARGLQISNLNKIGQLV